MKKTSLVLLSLSALIISVAFTTFDPPRFKNLKILPKNISKEALDSIMEHYSVSLGVKCGFCHVHSEDNKIWDVASDAKPEKLIARKMMLMTNAINVKYFPPEKGSKNQLTIQAITCYTCHKGVELPISMPEAREDSLNKNNTQ